MAENQFVENVVGQSFEIKVVSEKKEGGKDWTAKGEAIFGVTQDGKNWAYEPLKVSMHDSTMEEAIADVMLYFSRFMSAQAFVDSMNKQLAAFTDGK